MAVTALTMISNALNTAGIAGKEFRQMTDVESNDGLALLNYLLDEKTIDVSANAYYVTHNFNYVQGQESYAIDNLIYAELMTFTINSVRFQVRPVGRDFYFGTPRANNVQSLPATWTQEPYNGGTKIYVYYLPNDAYNAQIIGKFGYASVTKQTDMTATYPLYYIRFLTIELARAMCIEWGYPILPSLDNEYKRLSDLNKQRRAALDLRMKKISTLKNTGGDFYAYANLTTGWYP